MVEILGQEAQLVAVDCSEIFAVCMRILQPALRYLGELAARAGETGTDSGGEGIGVVLEPLPGYRDDVRCDPGGIPTVCDIRSSHELRVRGYVQ